MTADELFKAGELQQAIDAQLKEVKSAPADHARRLFLFELLAFSGDLDRARKQIDVIKYDELELEAALLDYRRLLDAEAARRKLFADGQPPTFFGEQPDHVHVRLEAVNRLREQKWAEAAGLLAKADELTPPLQGTLNEKAFDGFRDGDDLLGGVLEVMARGNYYWVPLEQVESVMANAPKFPRDLLWMPARLELRAGAAGNVFLPTLYAGAHEHADNQVKLGRMTDWQELEGGVVRGVGARTFLVGDDAVGVLDVRELTFAE